MSKIVIGKTIVNGKLDGDLKLDVDLLIPSRLLIQANSGGGKSYLLRRLEEALWKIKVQTIVIDPEGEFYTLREKFGYVLVGDNGETPADVRSAALLAEKFLQLKASAVCDLYEAFRSKPMQQRQWVRAFLNALLDAPRSLWHPLVVIVDEAHKFCPQETPKAGNQIDREIIGGCKDAMIALSTTGRKRGFCPIWATQRLAKLDKDASAEFFNRMVGMTIEDVDVDRAADLMSVSKADKPEFRASLRNLSPGEFYCFGRAITTERKLVKVGPVETHHPETGKAAKNAVAPPMPAEVKGFLPQLSDLPKQAEDKARTEAELKRELAELRRKLATAEKSQRSPVVGQAKADPDRMRREIERAVAAAAKQQSIAWASAVRTFQRELERRFGDGMKQIAGNLHTVPFQAPDAAKIEILSSPAQLPSRPVASVPRSPIQLQPSRQPQPPANGNTPKIGELHRKIASILAEYYPDPVEKPLLASMCGKTLGGGWNGRLSESASAGLLEYVGRMSVRATEASAREYAGIWKRPSNTEEAIAVWDFKLSDRHRAILQRLIEADGEPVSKAELAAAAGTTLGGGFNGRLSELVSTRLALYAGSGFLKANKEALFLNGEAA